MIPGFDPNQIKDLDRAREAIGMLLNLVEELKQENDALREEVQQLRDEVNRLKGEQGKPKIKPGKKAGGSDHSSEKERRQPKKRQRRRKVNRIKIDREEKLEVEQNQLPEDAEFKGYEAVTIQDLIIKTDNVRFLKEKYYSPSLHKTYLAPLPAGYKGEFGPGIRSLVITLYYAAEMTEPKIVEFLENMGILISDGQVSNMLIKDNHNWHAEKNAVYLAGLQSSSWQHIDDTATRVDGDNQHCHIICNPLYSAYYTRPRKDRLTVIDILANRFETRFLLNGQTTEWLQTFAVPQWAQAAIAGWPQEAVLTHLELKALVQSDLGRLNKQQQARVFEAAALTAYHSQTTTPIVPVLLSDDAPQFRYITAEHALCWVHEGRHYKKLMPVVAYHRKLLDDFRKQFWEFYRKLLAYRSQPSDEQAAQLEREFDTLFSTVTGYNNLDKRIAKTKTKKDRLLKVLKYPEIPLHNNPAELSARRRVRKRDISFGPRTQDGREAWDTFMTLVATAKKLGVSFYDYVFDRIAEVYALPSLAEIIQQQTPVSYPIGHGSS
jgi:FtsZ-binding cell division protein ZapB